VVEAVVAVREILLRDRGEPAPELAARFMRKVEHACEGCGALFQQRKQREAHEKKWKNLLE